MPRILAGLPKSFNVAFLFDQSVFCSLVDLRRGPRGA